MRTVIAALVACLLVVVTTADLFDCPDGCTDKAAAPAASEHPTSPCAICHGWSHVPVVTPSCPAPSLLARPPIVIASLTDPALPAVERPPKTA